MGSVVGGGLSPSRGPGGVLLSPPRIVAAPCRAAPRCDAYGTTFEERVIDDSSGRYLPRVARSAVSAPTRPAGPAQAQRVLASTTWNSTR